MSREAPSERARRASERVRAVLDAGRRIADAGDPLGAEARSRLPATSGLSQQGVELALSRYLERDASDDELAALVAAAGVAPAVHVVVSANVCTAALRMIALAVAAAPRVRVRPSRRDPVVAQLVLRALTDGRAGDVAAVADVAPEPGDALHVYGTDETVALYRGRFPHATLRGHGTGVGAAVVAGAIDPAAAGVADDVVVFDQRGCLSPRWVVVGAAGADDAPSRAARFAEALDHALAERGRATPRGPVDDATAAQTALYAASLEAVGRVLRGDQHVVSVDAAPESLPLPPAARVVHVVPASAAEAARLLGPFAHHLTTVGADEATSALAEAVRALSPAARLARLGEMQRPPFNGPVDQR